MERFFIFDDEKTGPVWNITTYHHPMIDAHPRMVSIINFFPPEKFEFGGGRGAGRPDVPISSLSGDQTRAAISVTLEISWETEPRPHRFNLNPTRRVSPPRAYRFNLKQPRGVSQPRPYRFNLNPTLPF